MATGTLYVITEAVKGLGRPSRKSPRRPRARPIGNEPDSPSPPVYPCPVTSRISNGSLIRRRTWLAVGLVAAAGVWVLINGPVEGPVLLVLSPDHGITVADLPSIVALGIAGLLFFS